MSLFKEIKKGLPQNIVLPSGFEKIIDWYENSEELMGGLFEFNADEDQSIIECWFGDDTLKNRFGVFGIFPDGSPVSFWITDTNEQKIIVLGSEGDGSYILANNFIDFIRLIAIGYDDFMYNNFDLTIQEWNQENDNELNYGVNEEFQNWLKEKFNVSIPVKGNEIVNKKDQSFTNWVEKKLSM